ncbi:MAG TPA: hypothetical protein VKX17_02665 [Planctomycetota bacterium]|nr:hypothetical protein [Planctomycetota bacterium]
MSDSNDFLTALMARRAELCALEPVWQLVDDVLNSNVKQRCENGWKSAYFPKGRLEPVSEYSLRVELTPFFPQTPQILASRLGALFKKRLEIVDGAAALLPPNSLEQDQQNGGRSAAAPNDGDASDSNPACETPAPRTQDAGDASLVNRAGWKPALQRFIKEAGRRHASFEDVATQAACLAQSHGFCAALLDRDPLPADLRDSEQAPSVLDAQTRNLGRPYLAVYAAPDVLDWDFGSDGRLAWVKFGERELRRASWDAVAEEELVYRVVDRSAIRVYRVRRGADGEWRATAETPLAHGFADRVPVVFLHPFPGADGIGRPILRRAAESDVASARVLSDLVWDLFVLGNPILTLKTSRRDEELTRLGLGASRYLPLRNGVPGQENAEELAFVQLDPTGIELLFRAHALFAAQGLPTAQATGSEIIAGAAIPREQSGVAQAWRFKTGEERILFMLARALEPFLNECLELAAGALGIEAAPVVKMPEGFDIGAN